MPSSQEGSDDDFGPVEELSDSEDDDEVDIDDASTVDVPYCLESTSTNPAVVKAAGCCPLLCLAAMVGADAC
jgi:hypothetical protein